MHKFTYTIKKRVLIVVMLFLGSQAMGQNHERLLNRIDSLALLGLPKSALAEVKVMDELARRQQNVPMQIKAVIYRMTLQSYLEENALVPIIDSLKADIRKASYPAKPVLQSLLAGMYYQYYNQNRWRFNQRTMQLVPGSDYTQWDLRTIINETSRLYQLSLADATKLQSTPIDVLDGILIGDKATRYLRPTLYDMLAQRALEFYLSDEPDLVRPKQPFLINKDSFFDASARFVTTPVTSTDTASTGYQGLKLLQKVTAFHLRKGDREAVADLDLQRLGFVYPKAELPNKAQLYLKRLQNIATQLADKPISSDALVTLGTYYKNIDSLSIAMRYFKQARAAFPDSKGGSNALAYINDLQTKNLSATVEKDNIPGKPLLVGISYRNVNTATLSVYKLSVTDNETVINPALKYPINMRAFMKLAQGRVPMQKIAVNLKAEPDYKFHTTEYRIDALKPGSYLFSIKESGTPDSTAQFTTFNVSGLAYIIRINPDRTLELKAMDRETGAPLAGVATEITLKRMRWDSTQQKNVEDPKVFTGITNRNGSYYVAAATNGEYRIVLKYKSDTLIHERTRASNYNTINDERIERTILFTDRQMYRPGQTIYFKGLQFDMLDGKNNIHPLANVELKIRDAGNKTLSTQTLKTNEYGTFTGQFILPVSILNGSLRLYTDYGSVDVAVEEYKRPTFKIEFLPIKQIYKLNDSVTIQGTVSAFSGYGLSNTKVAYTLARSVMRSTRGLRQYAYPELTEANIIIDTVVSDNKGVFKIKFKALPPETNTKVDRFIRYTLRTELTDAAGETHTALSSVDIGNNSLSITDELPEKLLAEIPGKAKVSITNLNDQPQNGEVRIKVYALKNPTVTYQARVWYQQNNRFIMSADEYKQHFAAYGYNNAADYQTWQQLNQVNDMIIKVDSTKSAFIDLQPLAKNAPGVYKVVLSAQTKQGDTVSVIKYTTVVAEGAIPFSFTNWVVPVKTDVKPGEEAEFLIGSDKPNQVWLEKYDGPKLLSGQWLILKPGMQKVKVDMGLKARGQTRSLQFTMMLDNRVYTSCHVIACKTEDNDINIKLVTYKNKLQPGEKDQWKLQLSTNGNEKLAAEMVATMYDASLNELQGQQAWQINAINKRISLRNSYYNWLNVLEPANTMPVFYNYARLNLQVNDYETLNLFTYRYFGGYNYAYHDYLRLVRSQAEQLELQRFLTNPGKKITVTGTIIDAKTKEPLTGAVVSIPGRGLAQADINGKYTVTVPENATLTFSFVSYVSQSKKAAATINVALQPETTVMQETVIRGYTPRNIKQSQGRTGIVTGREVMIDHPVGNVEQLLQGKVAGLDIQNISPGARGSVNIRGTGATLNGKEFVGGDAYNVAMMYDENLLSRVQNYGNQPSKTIVARKNFNETVFFYPQLHTDDKGQILIDFTMPEALTQWHFKAFAHDKELNSGYIEQDIVTQKVISISANTPRFLREGDTITVSARLANLSSTQQKGKVELQPFNALNMQPIRLLLNAADARQDFDIATATTKAVSFKMVIPAGLDAVTYRLTADAGKYSDGEENTLPVLPNRMLVTESMPMMVRGGQQKSFTFDKLANQNSATLKSKSLTLEYTQNPAWYAVQALPYMMEFPYECSEQIFSRYYANSLGTDLVNKMPVIKSVFDRWKITNATALLSNLEKNQELKSVLLEETPWLRDAVNETEQKQRIALLFDFNKMSNELDQNLDKLTQRQLPGGGFPWFAGKYPDRYITQHIIAGIGQLKALDVADAKNAKLEAIANRAIAYLDNVLMTNDKWRSSAERTDLSVSDIHAWYARSYFDKPTNAEVKTLLNTYLNLAAKEWVGHSIYEQGLIALTMQRNGRGEVAGAIIKSLKETAKQKDDMGMYWANNRPGWYWYEAPIETQSLMIELFTLIPGNEKEVEEMKIWLLRNKQTSNWKTTKATAAAVYALLLKGSDLLNDNATSTIKLNNADLQTLKPDTKAEAGTGYLKTTWADDAVKPAFGNVSIANNSKAISWGALHWQYLENLDKITSSTTDITLERKYFIQQQGNAGAVLQAVDATHTPKVGDVLKVVVYLKAGRDMEYIHLKDMRPAGTEPVDLLSTYKYQDGLYYYQVTKDVATNFFISQMKKGNYVFEYSLRVAQPGNFSTGISTVQCMYAPEFNAHSEGGRMLMK